MSASRTQARKLLPGLLAAAGCLAAGCSSMSNTEKGMGIGALGGAGVGALVGDAHGNAGAGAAIGAAAGAIGGALIGNDVDKQEKRQTEAQLAAAQAQADAQARALGMTDVATLAGQGGSDQVIINQIR